jgi:N-acetylglucosamine kinase-like BadF-type ATPase
MQCVLGVDGGNTKTLALVADLDGRILGTGRSGCGDIYNARGAGSSEAAALANIGEAVTSALSMAGIKSADLSASVFNMAGVDWPEDWALIEAAMHARGFGQQIIVQNDALGVLHEQVSSATGVSVICGTGGAIGARAPDGRTWHSSRWQDQVQGSGDLGQETLFALCRAELGIDPPTTLTRRVLNALHVASVEEVLHFFTSRASRPHRELGRLAPILLDEAQAGDDTAQRIVSGYGRAIGNFALAAARRVGIEHTDFALAFAGGMFHHPSPLLPDLIAEVVRSAAPGVRPMRCRFEPIVGVVFSALEAAGVSVDELLVTRLVPTLPSAAFFATDTEEALVASTELEP